MEWGEVMGRFQQMENFLRPILNAKEAAEEAVKMQAAAKDSAAQVKTLSTEVAELSAEKDRLRKALHAEREAFKKNQRDMQSAAQAEIADHNKRRSEAESAAKDSMRKMDEILIGVRAEHDAVMAELRGKEADLRKSVDSLESRLDSLKKRAAAL